MNLLNNLKTIFITILISIGAIFGIYQSGKKNGKKNIQNKNNKKNLENIKTAWNLEQEINDLSDPEIDSRLRNHTRDK